MRGRGKHVRGKHPLLDNLDAVYEAMQAATGAHVMAPYWSGGNVSLRINVEKLAFDKHLLQDKAWSSERVINMNAEHLRNNKYSLTARPMRQDLVFLQADTLTQLQQKWQQTMMPREADLTQTFRLPSGLGTDFWQGYWARVQERIHEGFQTAQEQSTRDHMQQGGRKMVWQYRNGKLLLIRLGEMSPQRQTHTTGNTAPTSRGVWAFPYPHFDMFFAAHKIDDKIPKRLKRNNRPNFETASDEELEVWDNERDAWIKKNAPRPKTFWYGGDIYARFDRMGNVHYGSWTQLSARQFYDLQNKIGEQRGYAYDHLEVFIPGKERGRV